MSLALGFDFDVAMFNSESRLKKVLKDNSGHYTISKNGYVELDLTNKHVQQLISDKIQEISDIEEEKTKGQADK
ncbi:TPA: hypothetical protein ACIC9P_003069 [Morganella morganii]|nr:hypothetical protein [Morganella morganii]